MKSLLIFVRSKKKYIYINKRWSKKTSNSRFYAKWNIYCTTLQISIQWYPYRFSNVLCTLFRLKNVTRFHLRIKLGYNLSWLRLNHAGESSIRSPNQTHGSGSGWIIIFYFKKYDFASRIRSVWWLF